MRDTFIASLIELSKSDDRVALLTGDLGFGVVEKFAEKFPDRFWNCGVAEQSMMSIAAGLAKSGMRPYVYSIANFPTFRCLEQIRNDVCYHNLPVTIVSVGGGLGYGTLGYTHHGIEDVAALRPLPNISIYSPADPREVEEVLNTIHFEEKPAYLRLGKNGEPIISSRTANMKIGTAYEIQSGTKLTVLASGPIAENCFKAISELGAGLNIQLLSVPKIQPLDVNYLNKVIQSQKILVVEEHVQRGGLASALLESFNQVKVFKEISHLFVKEENISSNGNQNYLRGLSSLDVEGIKNKIVEVLNS